MVDYVKKLSIMAAAILAMAACSSSSSSSDDPGVTTIDTGTYRMSDVSFEDDGWTSLPGRHQIVFSTDGVNVSFLGELVSLAYDVVSFEYEKV